MPMKCIDQTPRPMANPPPGATTRRLPCPGGDRASCHGQRRVRRHHGNQQRDRHQPRVVRAYQHSSVSRTCLSTETTVGMHEAGQRERAPARWHPRLPRIHSNAQTGDFKRQYVMTGSACDRVRGLEGGVEQALYRRPHFPGQQRQEEQAQQQRNRQAQLDRVQRRAARARTPKARFTASIATVSGMARVSAPRSTVSRKVGAMLKKAWGSGSGAPIGSAR